MGHLSLNKKTKGKHQQNIKIAQNYYQTSSIAKATKNGNNKNNMQLKLNKQKFRWQKRKIQTN